MTLGSCTSPDASFELRISRVLIHPALAARTTGSADRDHKKSLQQGIKRHVCHVRRGHPPQDADSGISFIAFGGTARIAAADAWEMVLLPAVLSADVLDMSLAPIS